MNTPRLLSHRPAAAIPALALLTLALLATSSARAQAVTPVQPPAPPPDDTVALSPFVVSTTQDKGYFAASTLSGTRLNTNIGDLPSSITVVTKQQMEDTNSLDINDVFRYESNTEGASTYTPFVLTRSNVTDTNGGGGGTSGNYTSALTTGNRVRGLAAVDQNEDNFFTLYRIPFDSYNTQSIEIDRGPNSLIFGTGSPAGIVNQTRIQPTLTKLSGEAELQVSSYGGYRESLGFNIPLVKDKLAIYVGQLYASKGFEQKPAKDLTRRQYAALTFEPFKTHKTRITASFENYNNYANDPNSITPIDAVSPWLASGRPVYNQVTSMVNYLGTGASSGPYALSTTAPNYVPNGPTQALLTTSTSPYFVPSMLYFSNHVIEFVDQGVIENTYKGQQTAGSVPGAAFSPAYATLTPAQQLIYAERPAESTTLPPPALANGTAKYAVWYLPGLVSKNIYDWSTINLNSLDNNYTRAKTYTVDIQQELLPHLNLDVSWFRQELKQTEDDPTSQASAPELFVDVNTVLPNGAPNPHVGQPFLDTYQSDVFVTPEINNNYRAMLAYELDLREKVPSWMKFLGHHRFVGAFSQHDDVSTNLRYRPSIYGGDPNYLPTTTALAASTGYAYTSNNGPEQVHYLGGATSAGNGFGASSPGYLNGPGYGGPTSTTVTTYNYQTNQWQPSTVNYTSVLFATGAISENLQDQKSYYWQSYFWNDRLVGTIGIDDDEVKNRSNLFPTTNPTALEYTNGYPNPQYWFNEAPWSYSGGNTSSMGFVAHPFKNWSRIDNAANDGNYLAGFARTLGFSFNKAGNFNPPSSLQTDFFGSQVGKPAGAEKDYGIQFATPDNKFFLKATWFTNANNNVVVGSFTSVSRGNYLDATLLKDWATAVVQVRNGQNPNTDPNFGNVNVYPITAAEQTQIAALTGLPYNYGGNVGEFGQYINPTGTENAVAKGIDLELNYNPNANWTMKLTWGKQQTVVSGAATQSAAWFAYRMPKWVAYTAPDVATVYTKTNGAQMYLGNFWQGYGYDSNVSNTNTTGLTTSQNYFNSIVQSQLVVDQAANGGLAPNQREYSWTYLTNYKFTEGALKNFGVTGVVSYSGRLNAGYYGNTSELNSSGQIAAPDTTRPIYTPGRFHLDLGVSYQFRMWRNIGVKMQLNVADLTSNGYLLPVSFNFDGSPAAERIIQPRQFAFTTKFFY